MLPFASLSMAMPSCGGPRPLGSKIPQRKVLKRLSVLDSRCASISPTRNAVITRHLLGSVGSARQAGHLRTATSNNHPQRKSQRMVEKTQSHIKQPALVEVEPQAAVSDQSRAPLIGEIPNSDVHSAGQQAGRALRVFRKPSEKRKLLQDQNGLSTGIRCQAAKAIATAVEPAAKRPCKGTAFQMHVGQKQGLLPQPCAQATTSQCTSETTKSTRVLRKHKVAPSIFQKATISVKSEPRLLPRRRHNLLAPAPALHPAARPRRCTKRCACALSALMIMHSALSTANLTFCWPGTFFLASWHWMSGLFSGMHLHLAHPTMHEHVVCRFGLQLIVVLMLSAGALHAIDSHPLATKHLQVKAHG